MLDEHLIKQKALTWTNCRIARKCEEGYWEDAFVVDVAPNENTWHFTVISGKGMEELDSYPLNHEYSSFYGIVRVEDSADGYTNHETDLDVLSDMERKYAIRNIYTFLGPVLYIVNPFERLSLYNKRIMDIYVSAGLGCYLYKLPAHSFVVGDNAYRQMFMDPFDSDMCENQTIVITGDSGAGKTECSKQIVRYLMTLSSSVSARYGESVAYEVEMQDLILSCIPITESFGNAKTFANDNSSRYGRYIELCFSTDGYLEGALIRTFLLESSRVCCKPFGERNFHVFYEVIGGLAADKLLELGLTAPSNFCYLCSTTSSGSEEAPVHGRKGVSDSSKYAVLANAMTKLGFSQETQFEIVKIVAAVLHLGNIKFQESSGEDVVHDNAARIHDDSSNSIEFDPACHSSVSHVCRLLSLTESALLVSFIRQKVVATGKECVAGNPLAMAYLLRDRLARTLYSSLFSWIMVEINRTLGQKTGDCCVARIGILDTIGFEDLWDNSFEQLCINYASEKLHCHMVQSLFDNEQQVYSNEGMPWNSSSFSNNSHVLDVFEHRKTGVFACLKASMKVEIVGGGASNDQFFLRTLQQRNMLVKVPSGKNADLKFSIVHSSRQVNYSALGFVEKNRGIRDLNFSAVFTSSEGRVHTVDSDNSKFLRNLSSGSGGYGHEDSSVASSMASVVPNSVHNTPERGWGKRSERAVEHLDTTCSYTEEGREVTLTVRKKTKTVSSSFRDDLSLLITHIATTRSHFIKCVTPNDRKAPGEFDVEHVRRQFKAGELESMNSLSKELFPVRIPLEIWVRKFRVCMSPIGVSGIFQLLKAGYRTRNFKYAAEGLVRLLPTASKILRLLTGDTCPQRNGIGIQMSQSELRVTRRYVFMTHSAYRLLEELRVRSLEFITLRLQSLRLLARLPTIRTARNVAAAAIAAHRHDYTCRMRRDVMSSLIIYRSLRRWAQSGRGETVRCIRRLRRGLSARRIQKLWLLWHQNRLNEKVGSIISYR